MRLPRLFAFLFVGCLFAGFGAGMISQGQAQGLIWSLPADGTQVRFEGTVRQVIYRPQNLNGDLELEWIRHLTIKSVGRESAEYDGREVSCRWIEIKATTGTSAGGLVPGPVGERIYKVLIPEESVIGVTHDDKNIPVSFLPIVKGYKKIGEAPTMEIQGNLLQVYPLLTMLPHYRTLEQANALGEDPGIRLGPVTAKQLRGQKVMESRSSRSTSESQLWLSDDVPFGIAKWTIRQSREKKGNSETRDNFSIYSATNVEMEAHEVTNDAQSELVIPMAGQPQPFDPNNPPTTTPPFGQPTTNPPTSGLTTP